MKKEGFLLGIVIAVYAAFSAKAGEERPRYEFESGKETRTYAMYIPENLKPQSPLVVYTHGYGSNARWRTGLNKVAEREGFAVCYPDGAFDSKGKAGWNVGYPSQKGMTVDEVSFFKDLKEEVCSRFDLSRTDCFMTGMSNGGDLCYQLAFTAPGLFKAYASVAGLLFECTYLNNPLPQAVPFMEIHGDADTTSYWEGDHTNRGGWGEYVSVPIAVGVMAGANRCCYAEEREFPGKEGAEHKVYLTKFTGSPLGYDVELYRIEGGKHSWATGDIDTHEVVWQFFKRFCK